MKKLVRVVGMAGVAGAGLVLLAPPAGAHISPDKTEVPADSFNQVTLTVPHGCDESPTRSIAVEIPEGIVNAAPQVHPNWDVAVEMEPLAEPIEGEGEPVTERVRMITFSAQPGFELPVHYRETFTIGFRTPDTPGDYLFFKTVQTCVEGETAWIEEYTGEGEEPDNPSPVVLITEAEGDEHGGGTDDTVAEEAAASDDGEEAVSAEDEDDDDSDSATGIAIAGLVAGALGLGTGGLALARSRKQS